MEVLILICPFYCLSWSDHWVPSKGPEKFEKLFFLQARLNRRALKAGDQLSARSSPSSRSLLLIADTSTSFVFYTSGSCITSSPVFFFFFFCCSLQVSLGGLNFKLPVSLQCERCTDAEVTINLAYEASSPARRGEDDLCLPGSEGVTPALPAE